VEARHVSFDRNVVDWVAQGWGIEMSRSEMLEAIRILSRYKRMVLLGQARLPIEAARRLIGPDCAYHLYFRATPPRPARTGSTQARQQASRRRRKKR
jgi:hypothetical protein